MYKIIFSLKVLSNEVEFFHIDQMQGLFVCIFGFILNKILE